jgi:hypothetical protein
MQGKKHLFFGFFKNTLMRNQSPRNKPLSACFIHSKNCMKILHTVFYSPITPFLMPYPVHTPLLFQILSLDTIFEQRY